MTAARLHAVAWLLLLAAAGMNQFVKQPAIPPVLPLSQFPAQLGPWHGADVPLDAAVLQALQLHDYLNRVYTAPDGRALGLYIAYYPQQRFGDDIHSPKNCLPGTGWEPLSNRKVTLAAAGRMIQVNQYLVARGPDRALVLYWYQQDGRVVASEYWSKADQIWDGLTRRRSDAALVRVAVPAENPVSQAEAEATAFIHEMFPRLPEFIPR